jgi:hypothetical protein
MPVSDIRGTQELSNRSLLKCSKGHHWLDRYVMIERRQIDPDGIITRQFLGNIHVIDWRTVGR